MVSKTVAAVLLITALFLSSIATCITITTFNTAQTPEQQPANSANVGIRVLPSNNANVGVKVIPEKEEK